jgi:hypothetical protein
MATERIPDPGSPRADGYYLQHARAALHAEGIRTMEEFSARYGVDVLGLTAFQLLWFVDRQQAERELHLNTLYRVPQRVVAHPREAMVA